ncbi:hypothetical protein L2E82_24342 [Cichorium intybus]|uniref:Uncharacterized protein n=1 Tax=Cichorium intybus TaxID=13427 RepID=A0ACB9E0X3_CICIN|nr:hypothetical protein L2E82_24342 [Cichorium intybus]
MGSWQCLESGRVQNGFNPEEKKEEKTNPNEASLVRGWQKRRMKNGKWCNQKAEDDYPKSRHLEIKMGSWQCLESGRVQNGFSPEEKQEEKTNPNEASLVRGWQKRRMKNGKWCNQKAEDDYAHTETTTEKKRWNLYGIDVGKALGKGKFFCVYIVGKTERKYTRWLLVWELGLNQVHDDNDCYQELRKNPIDVLDKMFPKASDCF